MRDQDKSREQLLEEVRALRVRLEEAPGPRTVPHYCPDTAERRRAEEALQEKEVHLRLLLEQLPAIIWTTDRRLRITSSNGAGLAGLDFRPGQLVGMTLYEVFAGDAKGPEVLADHLRA